MKWADPTESRDQLVLFSDKLDHIIESGHIVRLVDDLLSKVSWTPFESTYHGKLGQPPIHPRIMAGVILYGLICRIRASRKLEESLRIRVDFRWLAHGMSIDHSTLSEFRRKHPQQLRDLFVQVVLIGKELGLVTFNRIGFDGTRVRSNNKKTRTRSPQELRQSREKLRQEFDRLTAKADQEDHEDEETFGDPSNDDQLPPQQRLEQLSQAQQRIDAALKELENIEQDEERMPSRLPITDPESRFGKNKDGSFSPGYTPTTTVDIDSGLIVDQTVLSQCNESGELMPTINQVTQDYDLPGPVSEVLADGLMASGENLQACEDSGVELYSPVPGTSTGENPAIRQDLSQPVASDQIDNLPTKTIKGKKRFDKQAFVYDSEQHVYWCPAGKTLAHSSDYQTTEKNGKVVRRSRFRADKVDCGQCPLVSQCLRGKSPHRQIDRGEHEDAIERQRDKMRQEKSSEIYSSRRHAGERPFAVIKQVFGLRQFLTRGRTSVRQEWSWASIAFNLSQLIGHHRLATQPP